MSIQWFLDMEWCLEFRGSLKFLILLISLVFLKCFLSIGWVFSNCSIFFWRFIFWWLRMLLCIFSFILVFLLGRGNIQKQFGVIDLIKCNLMKLFLFSVLMFWQQAWIVVVQCLLFFFRLVFLWLNVEYVLLVMISMWQCIVKLLDLVFIDQLVLVCLNVIIFVLLKKWILFWCFIFLMRKWLKFICFVM